MANLGGLFSHWQNFEPTESKPLTFGQNFNLVHGKIIIPSVHTVKPTNKCFLHVLAFCFISSLTRLNLGVSN